jgi:mannose-6-phosphate isomerase-like protein (cupin superfamily)
MIKRKSDMTVEIRQNPKGGVGDIQFTHVLTQEAQNKANLFSLIHLEPGQSIGLHAHQEDAEAMYVLSGHPSIVDDGETYLLSPGDATYCTGGHTHSLQNLSSEPAQVLAIVFK